LAEVDDMRLLQETRMMHIECVIHRS